MNLTDHIRSVPDFPKPGILFYDITPLLANPDAFREAVRRMAEPFKDANIQVVAAAEARGFVFGGPIALELNVPLVPIRKPGKLPYKTLSYTYDLEYGTDTLEMHVDAVSEGDNVLLVDDLLATGGTIEACCHMVEKAGANVAGCAFLIELDFLSGVKKLDKYKTVSLLHYVRIGHRCDDRHSHSRQARAPRGDRRCSARIAVPGGGTIRDGRRPRQNCAFPAAGLNRGRRRKRR